MRGSRQSSFLLAEPPTVRLWSFHACNSGFSRAALYMRRVYERVRRMAWLFPPILPSLLVSLLLECHSCWSNCGRRGSTARTYLRNLGNPACALQEPGTILAVGSHPRH